MERLWKLPFFREQNCPCNLSGCGDSFVVDDFSVRFFPGLGNRSLAFSKERTIPLGFYICTLVGRVCKNAQKFWNYDSRLAVVYTDFLLFLGSTMTLSSFLGGGLLEPVATERRVVRVYGLQSPLRR